MIPSEINDNNNFIDGWFMEETSLCDDIITWFDNPNTEKYDGLVFQQNRQVVDKNKKDSRESALQKNPELLEKYFEHLHKVMRLYVDKYEYAKKNFNFGIREIVKIQKYLPNQGFKMWHAEKGIDTHDRYLVYMTFLNDVTDKGETEFLYQKLKVKPKKGLTLIWPADWTHTHRGVVSETETKYIVTGWFNYQLPNINMDAIPDKIEELDYSKKIDNFNWQ